MNLRTLLSFRLALSHARVGAWRMLLSVVAIALGVALVVAIRLMNVAVLQSFMEVMDAAAGRASLTVTAKDGASFAESVVDVVARVHGVTLAVPLVSGATFPDDGSGEMLTVHGVDMGNDAAVRLYHARGENEEIVDDLVTFLSQPNSIILGREFAERRGLTIGHTLRLATPTGVKSFVVRGLLDPQGLAKTLGGRLVVMDLLAAERMFASDGQITQVDVVVDASVELPAVRAAVANVLPAGLTVDEPSARKHLLHQTVHGFQAMLSVFAVLAVVAGSLICYSRMRTVFETRTWEIGLQRAIGLSRLQVILELLKESVLLGAGGTLAGIPFGVLLGKNALSVVANAIALNFRLPVSTGTLAWDVETVILGTLVGLLAPICAAAVPAIRLAHREPVTALRLRGRELGSGASVWRPRVGGALVILIALLLAVQSRTHLSALGILTTVLIVSTACYLAGPLVRHGQRHLAQLWAYLFGATGQLAAMQLRQYSGRASLTVATLGAGLGTILMFGTIAWSFERTLADELQHRMRADLVVNSAFVSGYVGLPISEAIVADLQHLPGVARAAGQQYKTLSFRHTDVLLSSYDPIAFTDPHISQWPLAHGSRSDALGRVARGEMVLVSTAFANLFQTQVGEYITFDTPAGSRHFEVGGITSGQPEVSIILSREQYRELWNDPLVSWIYVTLTKPQDLAAVTRAITLELGERYRLQVRSISSLFAYFTQQVRDAFMVLYLMEGIIFALLLIAIGDTLATSVLDRTRVFGMMRAVGVSRAQLAAIVVLEGTLLGALGLVLALVTGGALGAFWVEMQFPALLGWALELHVPTPFVGAMALATLSLCILGSLLPSLQAARLAVPVALRDE